MDALDSHLFVNLYQADSTGILESRWPTISQRIPANVSEDALGTHPGPWLPCQRLLQELPPCRIAWSTT